MPRQIYHIAFKDNDSDRLPEMVPVTTKDGRIRLFKSRLAARRAAGFLGTSAAMTKERVEELAEQKGLRPPINWSKYWRHGA